MSQGRFTIWIGNPQLTHLKNAFLRFSVGKTRMLWNQYVPNRLFTRFRPIHFKRIPVVCSSSLILVDLAHFWPCAY